MKILFLTNNLQVTAPLLDWLVKQGEEIICCDSPIDTTYISEHSIEFIVSYNYIHIIKKEVIDLLPHKIINLHISFLPYNKGTHPNIWSFVECTPNGVTIHEIDEWLDTGDILVQQQIVFDPDVETLGSSYDKLHHAIQQLFCNNWDLLKSGKIVPKLPGGGAVFTKGRIFAA